MPRGEYFLNPTHLSLFYNSYIDFVGQTNQPILDRRTNRGLILNFSKMPLCELNLICFLRSNPHRSCMSKVVEGRSTTNGVTDVIWHFCHKVLHSKPSVF